MTTDNDKLQPCPFCGSVPHLVEMGSIVGIECGGECDTTGLCVAFDPAKRETAIAAWNKRTSSNEPQPAAGKVLTDAQIADEAYRHLSHLKGGQYQSSDSPHYFGSPEEIVYFARAIIALSSRSMPVAPSAPLLARHRNEWHEDDGPVMWWAWCGHEWAGEAPWCGTPLDSDWPGYHTHWTGIGSFPTPPASNTEGS